MNKALLPLAAAALATLTGCVLVVQPGKPTHAEWAGDYASQQAERNDKDRDLALRVRKALNEDADLKKLGLRIFVDRGEVSLCGGFPDSETRSRAFGVVGQVNGVQGVDTDCGGQTKAAAPQT